jgi:hypothetical protein
MYYTVYKTQNTINGKFYIGAHKTENSNDGYLGSGVALNRAIKKYGIENFTKEVLYEFSCESEMFEMEAKLISEHLGNTMCYNMMPGGKGGFDHINSTGMHLGENNPMHNEEVKKKNAEAVRKTREKNPQKYKEVAIKNLRLATENNRGKKRPDHSEYMKNFSKILWEKSRDKMRDSLSSTFELTSPKGLVYNTNRLQDFCLEHDLTYTAVWKTSITNKPVKKGKAKGWLCKKI